MCVQLGCLSSNLKYSTYKQILRYTGQSGAVKCGQSRGLCKLLIFEVSQVQPFCRSNSRQPLQSHVKGTKAKSLNLNFVHNYVHSFHTMSLQEVSLQRIHTKG